MLRKIIFIAINYGSFMEQFTKAALLLFFSSILIVMTLIYQPFLVVELNILELYSNISVYMTIFSGAIYLQDNISDRFKIFLFIWILLFDLVFVTYWFFLCSKLFFFRYVEMFAKFCPWVTTTLLRTKKEKDSKRKMAAKFLIQNNVLPV